MKMRGALVACLVLGMTVSVSAVAHKVISANMKPQTIVHNGNRTNEEVIVHDNTTYVPLRNFSELVGVPVEYKEGTIYLGDQVNSSNSSSSSNNSSTQNNGGTSYIGESKAKNIAFQHAGVQEKDVKVTELKLDRDDNRMVYDVEFYAGNKEFDYEIDAITGKILSYDHDIEGFEVPNTGNVGNAGNSGQYIGKEKAQQIALNHANLTKDQVKFIENELDEDDGRWVYQVEFRSGSTEYDYEINAYTGEIVDYSVDND